MSKREIWHEILINASPSKVFEAISDAKKLSHWWTTDVRGESAVGKALEFWFSGFCAGVMEVTTLKPNELVCWHVTGGGSSDWIATDLNSKSSHAREKRT